MKHNNLDSDFDTFERNTRLMALVGFTFSVFMFLLLATTVYFFLAAAGHLPPLDLIPFIPYV